MDVTEEVFSKYRVPSDGGCLFWAVAMAYLLPVKANESLFTKRFVKLFGELNRNDTLRVRYLIDKDLASVYQDKQLAELVRNVFRNRVVDQMVMTMKRKEKVFRSVTIEDFVLMKNETFITDGTFCELFQNTFPILTHFIDLSKLKPEQLNEKSIENLNTELDNILDIEKVDKFKFRCYSNAMRNENSWAGEREIQAIESMLQCQIFIFSQQYSNVTINNKSVNICLFKAHARRYDFGLVKPEFVIEATMKLKYEIAFTLVKIGVSNVNFRYNNNWTLLHFATLTNDFRSIIKRLIWQGADLNLVTKSKHTSLQMAEYFELEKAIASLQNLTNKIAKESPNQYLALNQTSNPKQKNNEAKNSIKSITEIQIPCLNITIDSPKPNPPMPFSLPVHVFNNITRDLIEKKVNLNLININIKYKDNFILTLSKWSPLHYAVEIGNLKIVIELVEMGKLEVDIKDHNDGTPLKRAAKCGHFKMVRYLKERGADVNAKNKALIGALSCAARNGHDHIVYYLIENGAEINALDKDGMTPVHRAVQCGQVNALKCLVEHKANVNISDINKNTPLHSLIERGKWDTVKILLENGALLTGLSEKQKQNIYKQFILSSDKDDQLCRAISLGNVKLLEKLIFENNKKILKSMFKLYHKLKLLNVPLTHDMSMFIENKLMDDIYFSKNQLLGAETKVNASAENIKMRIDLIARCIDALEKCLKDNNNEIDDIFLFNGKCIAKNLQILKRQLRCTYHILPWEEMQFYLVTFLLTYIEPNRIDVITNLTMHETRLNAYLKIFKKILESVQVEDVFQICNKTTNTNRDEIKLNIISSTPQFKNLYDDFEHIKDVHSLNRIKKYISIACSIDLVSSPVIGQLAIERALQVTGECLKNTVESPNLSHNVNNTLLIYAPSNVRNILTSLRDSLSHVQIIYNNNCTYFIEIQNDLKKLQPEITYISFRKKCAVIKSFLERIISSSSMEDIMWVDNREMHFYDICVLENENNTCFDKIAYYLNKLKRLLRKPTDFQKQCVKKFEKFINQETKNKEIKDKHEDYLLQIEILLIDLIRKKKSLGKIQQFARSVLSSFLNVNYSEKDNNFNYIYDLTSQLKSSTLDFDEAQELILQIAAIIKLDAVKIQNIEEFNQLFKNKSQNKRYSPNLKNLDEEILLLINKLSVDSEAKNQMREEFRSKKNVHKFKTMLIKFFNKELLAYEIPDENQFRKWLEKINFKLARKTTYSSLYCSQANDKKCQDLVQQINQKTDDSYGKLIKAIKEKCASDFANEIHQFLKSFVTFTSANSVILETKSKTKPNTFFKKMLFEKMETLELLLIEVKNDSDFLMWLRTKDDFRAAIEMLMLKIIETVGNFSQFETNPRFLDELTPVLIRKNLRNYLAHGDLLVDLLSIDHLKFIIYHIRSIQNNCSENNLTIYDENKCIGNTKVENIDDLYKDYQLSLKLLAKQKKIISAVKENNMEHLQRILNNKIELKNRNFNGWTLLFYAAKTDNLDMFTYLFKHQTSVYYQDKLGHSILYYLAKYGSIKIVKHLIEHQMIDPNATLRNGKSLLHVSAEFGQNEMTNYLLTNKNLDANVTDDVRATPIYYAVINNHANIVSSLLVAGADIHFKNHSGTTLLHYAAAQGCVQIIRLLIHQRLGLHVDSMNNFFQTPLHLACIQGHLNAIKVMVNLKANVNAVSHVGFTPLHFTAQQGHEQVVNYLLENKAAINLGAIGGITALHLASLHGHLDVVKLLLEKGSKINVKTLEGNTPLHYACSSNHSHIVNFLLDNYKADVNAANEYWTTPFHRAAEVGSIEVVKLMLDHGANINFGVKSGHTPLHLAAQTNTQQVVELLLQHGADINAGTELEVTPLDAAMVYRKLDTVNLLLKYNADTETHGKKFPLAISQGYAEGLKALIHNRDIIDQRFGNDETLLHYATMFDYRNIAEFLLKKQANVRLLNSDGHSALHVAVAIGRKNVVEMILRIHPEIIDLKSAEGLSPLQVASIIGHRDLVELLIDEGAEINFTCNEAWTALHYAVTKSHASVVQYLLNHGAKVNAKTSKQSTPLHLAMRPELLVPVYKIYKIHQYKEEKINRIKFKVANCLIKFGAEVNAIDESKRRPLHWAAMNGQHKLIRVLCENNALLDEWDFMDRTALQWAGELGQIKCMVYLMMFGADTRGFIDKHFTEFY